MKRSKLREPMAEECYGLDKKLESTDLAPW